MGRPSREAVYERLEAAVDSLAGVGGLPLPDEAVEIWKEIWHEEAHHSTALEGNTLIIREVQLLLDQGKAVGSKELKAYVEVQGYGNAANWVYRQAVKGPQAQTFFSINEVREIHKLAMDPVWVQFPPDQLDPREGPGSYRRKNIEPFLSGMRPPAWPDVPAALTDWVDRANSPSEWRGDGIHVMEAFADLHAEFERIHPFRDGNGRVGRLVLNLMMVRFGYPPAVIRKQSREKYLKALARADNGECGSLGELLARAITESVNRFILPSLAGPLKLIPISALGTPELSHNALTLAAQRGRLAAVKRGKNWMSTKAAVEEYDRSRYRRKPPKSSPRRPSSKPTLFD